MYQVGITGNIGAGKSLVGKIFSLFGIPIYDADSRAKWLMVNDYELKNALVQAFGETTFHQDGQLNRGYLADIVFNDKKALALLNKLVHTKVLEDSLQWAIKQKSSYIMREAALLIESNHHKHLDFLVVVVAPEALRIKRTMQRDGSTEEQVKARMRHQMAESEKQGMADFVIYNDGAHSLIEQCWQLHHLLLKQASEAAKTADKE